MKLLCPSALAFFVLLCKAYTSVLDKLSQKNYFSLWSHAYCFITLLLENSHWVSTEAGPLVMSSPTLLEGNGERAFLSPVRICNKLHHLVG